jgi:hypothetical protein
LNTLRINIAKYIILLDVLEYLQSSVTCILKPSRTGGVGFFAVRDIEIGETMFKPWTGPSGIYSITHDELKLLPPDLSDNIFNTFHHKIDYIDKSGVEISIKKEYGKIFFPLERGVFWLFIWPKMFMNSGLNDFNVESNHNTLPVVCKKIHRGQEILGNYGSQFKSTPKNFI